MHVVVRHEVAVAGEAVPHALDFTPRSRKRDGRAVLSRGVVVQEFPPLPEFAHQNRFVLLGKVADGGNPEDGEFARRGLSHIQKVGSGQFPRRLPVIFLGDLRDGVGFFHIRAQFRKNFVETYADADRDADLALDRLADIVCDLDAAPQEVAATRDVQPTLVDAEGLNAVGIARVNFPHRLRNADIGGKIGGNAHEILAFLLRLKEGLARSDARGLCKHIFSKDDAVAVLKTPADGERYLFEFGTAEHLDGGVKII